MSFAFMPLYTGDYLRDTRHLSMSEHGAYLLMLTYCWDCKGPLPLDERKILGICNARSGDEIEATRRVLSEFFVRMEDGWYQPRIQREIERAEVVSNARSEAGKKGYQARAKQLPSKSQASASTPTPTLTPTTTPKEKNGSRFALTQPPFDWVSFCKQERPDLDPASVFASFSDYWIAVPGAKGRKADWTATWRNWVRSQRHGARKALTPAEVAAEAMRMMEEREREQA